MKKIYFFMKKNSLAFIRISWIIAILAVCIHNEYIQWSLFAVNMIIANTYVVGNANESWQKEYNQLLEEGLG